MEYKISELIFKSLSKNITKEEEAVLDAWMSKTKNKKLYNKIIDADYVKTKLSAYKQVDTEKAYNKIERQFNKARKRNYVNYAKYAAIFVGMVSLGLVFQKNYFLNNDDNVLKIKDEKITLQLDDGSSKTIDEGVSTEIIDQIGNVLGTQKGNQLTYNNQKSDEKLVYNTLIVPYGKRFEVVLSDGTKVHLNAGSSLKYPVKFIESNSREVFLKGEAYFDVAKNLKDPFIVNANNLGVKVYGTKFNASAYQEDLTTDVVLVEGSVGLYSTENIDANPSENVMLVPGQKGAFDKTSKQISTQSVRTYLYTAWINGELLYRNIPFKKIIPKLERHYNVKIINTNKDLDEELFYASFKDQSIENVLNYFSETQKIHYTIENNQIIIK